MLAPLRARSVMAGLTGSWARVGRVWVFREAFHHCDRRRERTRERHAYFTMTDAPLDQVRQDEAAAVAEKIAQQAQLDAAVARGELRRVRLMRKNHEKAQPAIDDSTDASCEGDAPCLALTVRGEASLSDDDSEVEEYEYIPLTPEERLQQETEARASAHWSRGNDLLKR